MTLSSKPDTLSSKPTTHINILQHTSASIHTTNIHQPTSPYIIIHQHTLTYIIIHQHTSSYINIHQHTSKWFQSVFAAKQEKHSRHLPELSFQTVLQQALKTSENTISNIKITFSAPAAKKPPRSDFSSGRPFWKLFSSPNTETTTTMTNHNQP